MLGIYLTSFSITPFIKTLIGKTLRAFQVFYLLQALCKDLYRAFSHVASWSMLCGRVARQASSALSALATHTCHMHV